MLKGCQWLPGQLNAGTEDCWDPSDLGRGEQSPWEISKVAGSRECPQGWLQWAGRVALEISKWWLVTCYHGSYLVKWQSWGFLAFLHKLFSGRPEGGKWVRAVQYKCQTKSARVGLHIKEIYEWLCHGGDTTATGGNNHYISKIEIWRNILQHIAMLCCTFTWMIWCCDVYCETLLRIYQIKWKIWAAVASRIWIICLHEWTNNYITQICSISPRHP